MVDLRLVVAEPLSQFDCPPRFTYFKSKGGDSHSERTARDDISISGGIAPKLEVRELDSHEMIFTSHVYSRTLELI
jgi:hypothetical protein